MLEELVLEMPEEEIHSIAELGGGLVLKQRRNVELTADFANNFLEISEFSIGDEKIDRNLQEQHVIHLAREMTGGTFRWEQVSLMTCVCNGREFRMNGQHTAWARIYADEELKKVRDLRTPVQWLKYAAASEQDMRQLYATIDRGKSRNRGMVVTSYLSGSEEFPGYSKPLLRLLAQGLTGWLWETTNKRNLHTGDEVSMLLLRDHHKTALSVGSFIKDSKPKDFSHLKRAPVVGAMFATFEKAPQIAHGFWQRVRDGVGITTKDDPQHTLRNLLLTTGLSLSAVANGDNRTMSSEDMYRSCILAWNAFRAGRSLKIMRPSATEGRPEVR